MAILSAAILKERLSKPDMGPLTLWDSDCFDPWNDIIEGVHGHYSSESDDLMIGLLEAIGKHRTSGFINKNGFKAELAVYILSGHNLVEYGTSPRTGWPRFPELWDKLIDKWKRYRDAASQET